ncbi:MAG TPA: hypothetical protein DCG47_01695 [Spirochaetaceae bacterium]|jgi:hypothetical protein|nr:hypothetical protein [Spirochaetaceae bacterium]
MKSFARPFLTPSAFLCALALSATALISCVSTDPNYTGEALQDDGQRLNGQLSRDTQASSGTKAANAISSAGLDYDTLIRRARESLELNRLAEGIRYYVAAMARAHNAGDKTALDSISDTLNEIGGRLTLEPHESWIAADGTQLVADIRAAAKGQGPMPAVYLYESYGSAKSPVGDASIRFITQENSATLSSAVSTDSKGLANASISRVGRLDEPLVVRAYPVFSAEGYSFALNTVFRDFSFAPPPRVALVAGIERTSAGTRDAASSLDGLATALKGYGFESVPYNGSLAAERFMAAYGGERASLNALAGAASPGYYALLLVEVSAPSQMQYQGKVYNIYLADSSFTLRILRPDGSLVYAEARQGLRGQGGSERAAIDDALVKAREALNTALGESASKIRAALAD